MVIKDKELVKLVLRKTNKKDISEVSEEDILAIEEITINNNSLSGSKLNIDLTDLYLFKGVKNLTLKGFDITDRVVETLNNMANVSILQLVECNLSNKRRITTENLTSIYVIGCKYDHIMIDSVEKISIQGCKKIDTDDLIVSSKTKQIYLQDMEVLGIEKLKKFENLEYINVDGSIVSDRLAIDRLPKQIIISFKDKNVSME